ncbi:hypothetical protein CspHIS471_0700090 [Cutaneotrichosporon sp. HIS471]|nr:hypothetical protein CspHIS471_0700090 [Cutaneotrichosporon sp. HIS471]
MLFSTLTFAPAVAAAVVHVQLTRRGLLQQSVNAINTDVGSGYSFPISLGTPPQDLSVFLGMGSGNGLTMFGCDGCQDTPFYQPNKSSTWNRTENVQGPFDVAYDTAQILGNSIPNAACAYSNSTYATPQYGLKTSQAGQLSFGLGLTASPKIQAVVPALAGTWDEPVFGLHLGSNGGQLSFGGVDNSLYQGALTYIPTINNRTWNFAADGLRIDAKDIDTVAYLASTAAAMAQQGATPQPVPDAQRRIVVRPEMGIDFMKLPPQLAEQMFAPIAGASRTPPVLAQPNEDQVCGSTGMPTNAGYSYNVPCNTTSTIQIKINGTDYDIPPAKWVVQAAPGSSGGAQGACKTRVLVADNENGFGNEMYDVLVGTVFLDSIYSAYRYDATQPQIGFAQLSDKAKTTAATTSVAVAQPTTSSKNSAIRHSAGAGVLLAAAVAVFAA